MPGARRKGANKTGGSALDEAALMIDIEALRKLLCERLCEDVGVEPRPDGALVLRTRFEFPDGDRYPIHLTEAGHGGLRLSDRGHTLMHRGFQPKSLAARRRVTP